MASSALDDIHARLARGAQAVGLSLDSKGYASSVNENLFAGHLPDGFAAAAGQELTTKMRAAHSSSALVANGLGWWARTGRAGAVAEALGFPPGTWRLTFEVEKPTGLRGTAPHLDCVLDGPVLVGCESKLGEPWSGGHGGFSPSYFNTRGVWDRLERCRQLATTVADGNEHFEHLDAPQLLKHAIGLATDAWLRGLGQPVLLLLWFEPPGHPAEAALMRHEIAHFASAVAGDLQFRAVTWQTLLESLVAHPEADAEWVRYITARYL